MSVDNARFSAFDIAFQAALPAWPLILLAVATFLALGLSAWRADRGFWPRLLAVAVLWLLLLEPTLVEEQRRGLPDIVLALLDDSDSQGIGDRRRQTELALEALRERAAIWPDVELRAVRLSQRSGDAGAPDAENGTRMFGALRRALVDIPRGRLAGVAMITDGQIHDAPDLASEIGIDAPLHALLTGARDEGDRRLTVVKAPRYGLVGKPQSILVRVDDLLPEDTAARQRVAELTIRQDGGEPRRLLMPLGQERPVDFTLRHGGQTVIELSVERGQSELSLANNRALVTVNGVRDRLRVLLVSGEPHAGERAWRNLLKSDPAVDLVHFTILRPPEKQDGTPINELSLIAFPIRELFEVKLDEFDLVIFDRYRRRGVLPRLYMRNIARYVESGGALLDAVGPTYAGPLTLYRTPLGMVLPGEPTGTIWARKFRPLVTDLGHRHPVTAGLTGANAPPVSNGAANPAASDPQWGAWFRQVEVSARRGVVLMTGARDRPLLILDRVGEGRVAQVLSDQMWLWARGYDGGGPQAELMRRLAHWLMKEPDLEEDDLRARVAGDSLTIARRSLEPVDRPVSVTGPDGETREVMLEDAGNGLARARISTERQGLFTIEDGAKRVLAVVGPVNPLEQRDFRATDAVLRPFVAESAGGILRLAQPGPDGLEEVPQFRRVAADRDMAGRDWIGFRENRASVVTGIVAAPLTPPALALLLALGALIAAWRREGR